MQEKIEDVLSYAGWIKRHIKFYLNKKSARIPRRSFKNGKLHIVLNGPSSKETIHFISEKDEVMMVNFAILSKEFWKIKPHYYCIIDPIFFDNDNWNISEDIRNNVKSMWQNFMKINWNMEFFLASKLNSTKMNDLNRNIRFSRFNENGLYLNTASDFLMKMYEKNLATPIGSNIAIISIYIGIQLGYREIFLHGLDFDRLSNYKINEKNEVLFFDSHYYESGNFENYTKIGFVNPGEFYTLVESFGRALRQFSILNKYASSVGSIIYNLSKSSMVDCFEKL